MIDHRPSITKKLFLNFKAQKLKNNILKNEFEFLINFLVYSIMIDRIITFGTFSETLKEVFCTRQK
jgi:hypothetical protein